MKIEMWPTEKPIPYEKNPRRNDAAVKYVANSIEQFGFRVPIIVDADGVIIAGHTRLKAAKKLKMKEVPVHVASDLDATQAKALRLADNKVSERAEWDDEMLLQEIVDLRELGVDEALLGFDADDMAALFGEAQDVGQTDEDAVPEVKEAPESVLGEIYQLGKHRLMCGSSTDKAGVGLLLGGKKIDLIFTDPPYGVSYADKNKFLNAADKGDRIQDEIENDHMNLDETGILWQQALEIWAEHLNEYSSYYICTASSNGLLPLMLQTMDAAGMPYRHQLIWAKNNHVLGRSDYNYKHEPILYGWANKHKFYGKGDQKFSVWEYNKPMANKVHPTMKPVELVENAILNSTEKGMTVCDLFLGSGTTIIAAEKTGRVCCGTELSPHYCDVIRRRWAEFVHGEGCDWQTLTPVAEE